MNITPETQRVEFMGIHLHRIAEPGPELSDRFESEMTGPHFPLRIWLERRSSVHQWCASFMHGCVAYSWSPEEALSEARLSAIRALYDRIDTLENLGK